MASIRARAAKGKGAATSVDVMNAEETESFATHTIADYDMKVGKLIDRRYFEVDGSFVTEAKIGREEGYERMKQARELDKDSLRKGCLVVENFETRAGCSSSRRGKPSTRRSPLVIRITRSEMWSRF
jgi:hypothetical protein